MAFDKQGTIFLYRNMVYYTALLQTSSHPKFVYTIFTSPPPSIAPRLAPPSRQFTPPLKSTRYSPI